MEVGALWQAPGTTTRKEPFISDALRRYSAMRDTRLQWYPATLQGHQRRHMITVAGLISGIVGCPHPHRASLVSMRMASRTISSSAARNWWRTLQERPSLKQLVVPPQACLTDLAFRVSRHRDATAGLKWVSITDATQRSLYDVVILMLEAPPDIRALPKRRATGD